MRRGVIYWLWGAVFLVGMGTPAVAEVVGTVEELVAAVNGATPGVTVLVRDGTYALDGRYLRISAKGVTLRSQSGNRERVILDGEYRTTEIVQIVASGVTVADLTLMRAVDHPVHVMGGDEEDVYNVLLDNLHIIDPGEQAIKINPSEKKYAAHAGIIRDCLIELTGTGRAYVEQDTSNGLPCYTGGIDGHGGRGWIVRDNVIRGFWCSTGLSEHGVHFWQNSSATLVERNLIIDCDRGIGFGLGTSKHFAGIIRNNMVSQKQDHGYSDVGIGLESSPAAVVYNNTVILGHDYPHAIEYRFSDSHGIEIMNNLTNRAIIARDGGNATLENNVTSAGLDWFNDAGAGDLHLKAPRTGVSGVGLRIDGLVDDYDRQLRPLSGGSDIGADQYSEDVPDKHPSPAERKLGLGWILLLDRERTGKN